MPSAARSNGRLGAKHSELFFIIMVHDKQLRASHEAPSVQYLVKRGVHTLRQSEYQLLYIEEGVASAAEREASKLVQRKQLFTC